jgi:poly(3-hydroxybutyrate) depolymerase
MKRLHSVAVALIALPVVALAASGDAAKFWALMNKVDWLGAQNKSAEALSLLEDGLKRFPEREFEIKSEMALVYGQLGQHRKSIEIWRAGHAKGLFYGLFPQFDWLRPFEEFPEFQNIMERDRALREEAERTATMRYEVDTPASYLADYRYPIFIVLHGGMGNIERARTYWRSKVLLRDYLVAWIQSSRPMSSRGYGWRGRDPKMRAELRKIYDEIVSKYPVDPKRVLSGGMAAGGMMSLDAVVHNVLPMTGYVVNCPIVPPDFEDAMADQVRERGIRGVMISGEKDYGLPRLKEMVEVFAKAGVRYRLTVVPGMGHAIPDNFPARLDKALAEVDSRPVSSGANSAEKFWALMDKADVLSWQNRAKEAVTLLEGGLVRFPGREAEITQTLAYIYAQLGDYKKSMEIWRAGHAKGLFYGLDPRIEMLKPFEKIPEFQSILDRDRELRETATRKSKMRYEIAMPVGYSAARKYPLFLVLHGGGGNIESERLRWKSPGLGRDYLVAYLQSFRYAGTNSFSWQSRDEEMRARIRKVYQEVVQKYSVDESRVFIGGMSAGGMISLDVVFHDVIPVAGFVVNCPVVPADFEAEMAEGVKKRGIRGVVITGDRDWGLARQKAMIEAFAKAGVTYRFTVIDGMGHDMPRDFGARFDAAMAEVEGKR